MKKIIFGIIFLIFFVIVYFYFSITKVNSSNFKIDYQDWTQEQRQTIKSWWNNFLENTIENFKKRKKAWEKISKKPYISSYMQEFSWNGIKSIVFKIEKNIFNKIENISKIFYSDENNNIIESYEIFKIENENLKQNFLKTIKNNLAKNEFFIEDIDNFLENYIKNMKFYFENENIIFIFDLWENSKNLSLDFKEIKHFLNPEKFPKIKEEIEKKAEIERKRQEIFKKSKLTENEKLEINYGKKYVALTFDDGPSNKTTPELLDILKKHDIKVTFFVLWKMAATYPEIIKRQFEEWHEIASHSWDHANFKTLSEEQIKKQISSTDEQIEKIIWKTPTLFRPPYGSHDKEIDKIVNKSIIIWNVDSLDWKYKNVEKNIKQTMSQVANWSIILYHDIHKTSVNTIEPLIERLKSEWYEFLTVSELLNLWQNWDIFQKICHSEFYCYNY